MPDDEAEKDRYPEAIDILLGAGFLDELYSISRRSDSVEFLAFVVHTCQYIMNFRGLFPNFFDILSIFQISLDQLCIPFASYLKSADSTD